MENLNRSKSSSAKLKAQSVKLKAN